MRAAFYKPGFNQDLTGDELLRFLREYPERYAVVDVRERDEYNAVHINRAHLLPITALSDSRFISSIDASKIALVHCRSGRRTKDHEAEIIARLRAQGVAQVHFMSGGIQEVQGNIALQAYLPLVHAHQTCYKMK